MCYIVVNVLRCFKSSLYRGQENEDILSSLNCVYSCKGNVEIRSLMTPEAHS